MSSIAVVGAHGKVARHLIPRLVAAGHQVTGVVRHAEQRQDITDAGATPLVIDVSASDTDEIAAALEGHDVVVWSAGAGGSSAERTYAVDRDAAIRTIDAAVEAGVPRFAMVSYFGAGPDHGVDPDDDFFAYAEAKSAADAHLAGSDLGWTILRPSTLTDDPGTGGIEAGAGVEAGQVARATVADVIAAAIDDPAAAARRTLAFNDGDQPVADALSASAGG